MATAETKAGTELMSGADILVQSLVDHGVDVLFAYPGGASMPLHQALTRFRDKIRTICRGMSRAADLRLRATRV